MRRAVKKDELNVSVITTAHAVWNTPSKRVLEKLGFKFINDNSNGFMKKGKAVPEYC